VLDWPLAAAAVAFALEGDVVSEATVVLGHVAPVPWTASAAAERLRGQSLSEATAATAAEAAVEGARPLSRNGYKVQLARTATRRAILRASSGDAVGSIPSASRIGRWSGPDTGTS
jgi:xanthine dehydrogenase YagS FAD-binding subunit